MLNEIDRLVDALGGVEAVGELLGIGRSGVAMWSTRGFIPRGWHADLLVEVKRLGLTVDPQLFDLTPEQLDVLMSSGPVATDPPARERRNGRQSGSRPRAA